MTSETGEETTYPVRVAARMTGLTPELIRAWESRYGAVAPQRTAGGTRRYSSADLERLSLLRCVVEAGHRIGKVAHLSLEELRGCLPAVPDSFEGQIELALSSLERLDAEEARSILGARLEELGAVDFALHFAMPLLSEIGHRWADGELTVSVEHLASNLLRSMLTEALVGVETAGAGPLMVFATPSGEPHDLGVLVSALVALRAGARPLFLGGDVPDTDLVASVERARADVLVLGIVTLDAELGQSIVKGVRAKLPDRVELWIGGSGIAGWPPIEGVLRIADVERLEALVTHLGLGGFGSGRAPQAAPDQPRSERG